MLEYLSLFALDEDSDAKTVAISGQKATQSLMYSFGILLILAMSAFTVVMYAALAHYAYKNRLRTVRVYVKPCVTVFLIPHWENGKRKKHYYTCTNSCAVNRAFINTMSKKYFKKVQRSVSAWLPTGRIED